MRALGRICWERRKRSKSEMGKGKAAGEGLWVSRGWTDLGFNVGIWLNRTAVELIREDNLMHSDPVVTN